MIEIFAGAAIIVFEYSLILSQDSFSDLKLFLIMKYFKGF